MMLSRVVEMSIIMVPFFFESSMVDSYEIPDARGNP